MYPDLILKHKKDNIFKKLRISFKNLKKSVMLKITILVICLNVILGFYYSYIEDVPFHKGLYWATDTVTNTGSGLVPPSKPYAWYLTTVFMWLGLGITLLFVEFVYVHMFNKMKGDKIVKYLNHIILIGWNSKIRHFLHNLPGLLGGDHNYVLVANLEEKPYDLPEIVDFIRGDPSEERILTNAGIEQAQQVIIVTEDDADAVLIAMTVQSINRDLKICVNLQNKENIKHLKRIDVEEIICDEELTGNALIKSFYRNKE